METLRCARCKEHLPIAMFHKNRARPRGYNDYCRPCWNSYMRDRRPPLWERTKHLRYAYKMTLGDYETLVEAQGGVCAICQCPETSTNRAGDVMRLAIDHDRTCCPQAKTCGRCIRGLLCRRCNQILGRLNEDVGLLSRMIDYVGQPRAAP